MALRETIRHSLTDWATFALAPLGQAPAPHHLLLLRRLQALASGQGAGRRLMIHMPPGSAKSTYASILFPVWWLARRRRSSVLMASHTADLAERFGRSVRSLVDEHALRLGYGLAPNERAARRFATTAGGEFYATGVRGPVVGRRADLAIIDDPVKSRAEAESRRAREQLHEWFRADLVTRLRPHARIVLIMTRWHPDDLAGRLAAEGGWDVLSLPAVAGDNDPLGREPGAPLWPEWEDRPALAGKRAAVGERAWAALYQQAPRAREGGLFDPDRIGMMPPHAAAEAQGAAEIVRAWDLAATAQIGSRDPDWTVGLKLMRTREGSYAVLDIVRLRGSPAIVEDAIMTTAARDGAGVRISLPQDPGQAGKHQALYLVRQLAGYRVSVSPESGSKETRAMPIASQIEGGNVALLPAPWNAAFLDELRDFPHGAKDDQVDALSRAFTMLTETRPAATRRNFAVTGR